MLEGLYSAAAGMSAQQEQLNAISNDLANVSTDGYKSERVAFSDLLYNPVEHRRHGQHRRRRGEREGDRPQRSRRARSRETGDPLDLAIEGPGFFQVTRANGQKALTRDGSFGVDASGTIVNAEGNRLTPPIKLPAGVSPSEVSDLPPTAP